MAWRSYVDPTDGQTWWTDDNGNFLPFKPSDAEGGSTPNPAPRSTPTSGYNYGDLGNALIGSGGQRFDELVRQFNAQMDLEGRKLGMTQQQIDMAKDQFAKTLAEQQRQFDRGQYGSLATTLLNAATELGSRPGEWLSYAQYTNGGRDIFQSLFGDQAVPDFSNPSGYSRTGNITDVLKALGITAMPGSTPGAGQAPGAGGASTMPVTPGGVQVAPNAGWDETGANLNRNTVPVGGSGAGNVRGAQTMGGNQPTGPYTPGTPPGVIDEQVGGLSRTAATSPMSPLPHQINPAVWDSMSSTAKQMILAAAGRGYTPSGAWTAEDYLKNINAARPQGTAPKRVSYGWQPQKSSFF